MPIAESTWERARDLVVAEGMDYSQAAERTGISLSALSKRAGTEGWMEARKAHTQRVAQYRSGMAAFKQRLLEKAVGSGDPQDVHALLALERAFPEHRYGTVSDAEKRGLTLLVIDEIVEYLGDKDPVALAAVQPHLRLMGERVMAKDWRSL